MLPSAQEGSTAPPGRGRRYGDDARHPWRWAEVTRQYLSGELSLRLGDLESVADRPEQRQLAAQLRRDAERLPTSCLGDLVWQGLRLGDEACRVALEQGAWHEFLHRIGVCSALFEFGLCSCLIDPAEPSSTQAEGG